MAARLLAGLLAVVFVWLTLTKIRDQNKALTERAGRADQLSKAISPSGLVVSEELTRLKRENQEIHRLRNEGSQLRALNLELKRLQDENQQLRASITSEKDKGQAQWAAWVAGVRTNGLRPDVFLKSDVSFLIQALTNDAIPIRLEAAKALRQVGLWFLLETNLTPQAELILRNAAKIAVPGLVDALKDSDTFVRANAAITLGFLGAEPALVVPALVEGLNDEQNRVAQSAAKALGRLQGDARSAIPALLQAAQSADEGRRTAAISALKQIDPESARKAGFE